jgi:hypothetical protein
MRIDTTTIKTRIKVSDNTAWDIIKYDTDNAYPQNIIDLVNDSGTAKSCINLYAKYIIGQGFEDEKFNEQIINRKKITNNQLLRKLAYDYARFKGFAVHFNYNANLKISEINYVPYDYCRMVRVDDVGYISQIAIYDDWGKRIKSRIEKKDIKYIDIFNPQPDIIKAQIERDGGILNYKGQIYWYSSEGIGTYPLAPFDAILEDIDTDAQIKVFKFRNVTTSFMANHLLIHKGKFESENEREEFKETLNKFQGAEESAKIMLVEVDHEEQIPELKKVEPIDNDTLYEYTEQSVKSNIIESFGQPSVLLGREIAGKLGMTKEIPEWKLFYSEYTADERAIMSKIFQLINENYQYKITDNFNIIPIISKELLNDGNQANNVK